MGLPTDNTLGNLLDLYTKAKGTTSTTTSNISKEGVDSLIQQILSSTQGLAAVSSGQKGSGLYNSSTNQLLTNDLITQTAAKTAAATSGSTTKTSGAIGKGDAQNALLLLAGKSLLGPSIAGAGKKLGLNSTKSLGDQLADFLGLGSQGGINFAGSSAGIDIPDFSASFSNVGADSFASSIFDPVFSSGGDFSSFFGTAANDALTPVVADTVTSDVGSSIGDFLGGLFG